MLWKKKQPQTVAYDKDNWKPVLRCSICTGEQVAGLKNLHTGEFKAGTLIKNEKELKQFMAQYGIEKIDKEY